MGSAARLRPTLGARLTACSFSQTIALYCVILTSTLLSVIRLGQCQPSRNSRHERFAQAVASGMSASEAYRQSGATGKNADVHAARLMVNDGISKRVAELKAAQAQKSELSRDQLRQFLPK